MENKNFIETIIDQDIKNGLDPEALCFRFPPEPNGFLHIGHVKAIVLNFELAKKYKKAKVNLRFDDTNPEKEDQKYIDAIKDNIKWLGYSWDKECYASDYFNQLYEWACMLIKQGKAYIDSQTSDQIALQKGAPTDAGQESPYRSRSKEENLLIFNSMKEGKCKPGEHVLRAKINMLSPNMLMRDPIIYRVLNSEHPRTKKKWVIFPMYDWTHGESDYIEQITHSLCTLEFKPHRELYDWFLNQIVEKGRIRPKQREFARLNLSHTITSKRKLLFLVKEGIVSGWDDPRMPTISGLKRRGYTPKSLKKFVTAAGVAKRENVIEMSLLEFYIREELNQTCNRMMVVHDPIKLTITNLPHDYEEELLVENNPEDPSSGKRKIKFTKSIFIEKEDFMENPPKKFFRLSIGAEVRLKGAYIIKANKVNYKGNGDIDEVYCTYDQKSRSGSGTEESMRRVKGTLHWVSSTMNIPVVIREYDRLFLHSSPGQFKTEEFNRIINQNSATVRNGYAELEIGKAKEGDSFQFQRKGYYIVDKDSTDKQLVFNKTVSLRDNWKKINKKN